MSEKHSQGAHESNMLQAAERLENAVEELLEVIEIEEWGKRNERPPRAKRYVIRIDKVKYTVDVPQMSGLDLLKLAGKVPPEKFTLSQKMHGGHVKTIGLDEIAEFTCPGIERFMTLPLDQTEG
jgi:hypothetical protein